jgi:hypothetical protein
LNFKANFDTFHRGPWLGKTATWRWAPCATAIWVWQASQRMSGTY